ncbi:transporter substrate-binding domain-containing protein [Legionella sp. MW5194]|uniref:transporter substrate-binding domain-containing protein n=1 Tax=Legionella sp. MW5194 TaxID=2662448 RepID=UPI00193D1895|nr:transporter substrate-binding domain-containing protein [Legionella sp. MW5194]QRN03262.1 transporter substrate-binding domain-containing protein [Legionella sp. MW5194]
MMTKWMRLMLSVLLFLTLPAEAKVKIGTPIFDPPFVMNDSHFVNTGFDVDLMQRICSRLKWQCEFVTMPKQRLLEALGRGEIDYAMGSLAITPERETQFLFTIPYFLSSGGFIVMRSSPLTSIEPLAGRRIGVMEGTVYADYLLHHPELKVDLQVYSNIGGLVEAMKTGKIEAAFINYYSVLYLEHQYPGIVKALKGSIKVGYGMGIATRRGNEKDIEKINAIITEFENDGTFVMLYNYYFTFFAKDAMK